MVDVGTATLSANETNLSAASFLGQARTEFLALGQKLVGDIRRDPDRDQAIAEFVRCYLATEEKAAGLSVDIQREGQRLLHRFEVLCARIKRPIEPPAQREPIYRELLDNLVENVLTLKIQPEALVTATLLNQMALSSIPTEASYSELLARDPYLLRRAFVSFPAHPREFLSEGILRLAEINQRLEESGQSMQRRTRMQLAFNHREVEVAELLNARREFLKKLQQEPEFRMILSGRASVAEALIDMYSEDQVRPRLREIHLFLAQTLADERFAELRKKPGDIIIAAMHHAREPGQFLLRMLEQERRLKTLMQGEERRLTDGELRRLCLQTPQQADSLEQRLIRSHALSERVH